MDSESPATRYRAAPSRLARLLCCATFPLIWIGGLVTTTDAGMAVPDWPTTYGYNLFLYPWQSWVYGPWELFIEHGHRLLGAVVGLLTLVYVASVWHVEPRRWLRFAALLALVLVVFQGLLGGLRVWLDQRTLAMLHGCTGPLFFAWCAALAVWHSRFWQTAAVVGDHPAFLRLARGAVVAVPLFYLQLVLGAQVRHQGVGLLPSQFLALVAAHVVLALLLSVYAVRLVWQSRRLPESAALVRRSALALGLLVVVQLLLGGATWIGKYGWPAWFRDWSVAESHLTLERSVGQSLLTTAHVALGSLLLARAVVLALRAWRQAPRGALLPAAASWQTQEALG